MTDLSRTPVYNLKAVVRETGLTAELLHAWERRYNLPLPQRAPGSRRLYSQADIAMLKWLKARQEEGLSISRATERWKELVAAGRDPLAEVSPSGMPWAMLPGETPDIQVTRLRNHWLEACRAFDESAADQVLNMAFSLYPVEMVCREFLQRGLSQLGDEWAQGKVSVQQEHFASGMAMRRLASLIASTPPPQRATTILAACPPGEWHTFPLQLFTLLLRRRGFRVVNLGGNVPLDHLSEAIASVHPTLVVLAAQTLVTAASLHRMAIALRAMNIPAVYGGLVFNRSPRLRERIPAHFLAETIEGGLEILDQLSDHPIPVAEPLEGQPSLQAVAQSFRLQREQIDVEVLTSARLPDIPAGQIQTANAFLGDELSAALDLDDPTAFAEDLHWIQGILARQGIPRERLRKYLVEYQQAAQTVMGTEANEIIEWLRAVNFAPDAKPTMH